MGHRVTLSRTHLMDILRQRAQCRVNPKIFVAYLVKDGKRFNIFGDAQIVLSTKNYDRESNVPTKI